MSFQQDIALIEDTNKVHCLLCDEVLENNGHIVESHLDGKKHCTNCFKRVMATNSILIKSPELLICQLCNQDNIKNNKLSEHIKDPRHCEILASITEMLKKDGQFMHISNTNTVQCDICDKHIDFDLISVESHIRQSTQHIKGKAMIVQPLNGIFSVEDTDDYLWCKVCQLFFDNYIELIHRHIEDSDHAKTMRKIKSLIKGQDIDIDRYLQSLKEDKAFCNKCQIEVPCNVDNLQSHVKGKKHLQAM